MKSMDQLWIGTRHGAGGSPSAIELLSLECHAVHVMVALAVEVFASTVMAVAVALHVADGGHGVGGRAHGV